MQHFLRIVALIALMPFASLLMVPAWALQEPVSDGGGALPSGVSPAALTALAEELLIDEPGDGRTWARGLQWKASFGPEGFTYIPFFGSEAPQNYPVAFDLDAVTIGGEPIGLLERVRERRGQTVALDRGSLREVYHLSNSSVEQTFVFGELPSRGEIRLDVTIATELFGAESGAGGFTFSNDLGSVHYGRAFAVDAAGSTLELEQHLTDGGLQIVVPADFVRVAKLPLTVDPIVSTFVLESGSPRQLDIDVAYDTNSQVCQIVYSQVQSALDIDVIGANYHADTATLLPATGIDLTSSSWNMPRNASNKHEQQFLCVAVVGNIVGNQVIWGRTKQSGTSTTGPQFQISGVGAVSVDVGGKGNETSSIYDYMVVWQEVDNINQDMDIVAQAVNGNSSLTASRIMIDGDVGDYDRAPAISKSSGRSGTANGDNEYMIVWERQISPTNRNIRAQVIAYTGSMNGHNQFNAYTFSDSINPDVSTLSRGYGFPVDPYWVVVFERLIGSDYDIFAVVAKDGDVDNARNINVMQNLDLNLNHSNPTIAQTSDDYSICYQTEGANGDRAVHFTSANVVSDGDELRIGLSLRRETLARSEGAPASFGIASYRDGGGLNISDVPGDALVAWTFRDASSNDTDAAAAVITEYTLRAMGSQYCAAATNSTGASAWMEVRRAPTGIGVQLILACSEMPPNTFGFFLAGTQSGFVQNPSGSFGHLCLQGAIGRFNGVGQILNSFASGRFTLHVDPNELPSPFGTVAAMSGETWNFQSWFRESGGNSNFSNAVAVTFN